MQNSPLLTFNMNRAALLCIAFAFVAVAHGGKLGDLVKELRKKALEKKDKDQGCDEFAAFEKCRVEVNLAAPNPSNYDWNKNGTKQEFEQKIVEMNPSDVLGKFDTCWKKECPEEEGCDYSEVFWECQESVKLDLPDLDKYDWTNENEEERFFCDIMKKNGAKMAAFETCWMGKCPEAKKEGLPTCGKPRKRKLFSVKKQSKTVLLKKLLKLIESNK